MPRQKLDFQMDTIKEDILRMTLLAEEQLRNAMTALSELDSKKAHDIIEKDKHVNELYAEIKERCIQTIALQQPVAKDLRFISISMDVATNLERIGDYAVDIAKNVNYILDESPNISQEFNRHVLKLVDMNEGNKNPIMEMGEIAADMVNKAGPAFIHKDVGRIEEIHKMEDNVDKLFAKVFRKLEEISRKDAEGMSFALNIILTARYLERIADHSVNIAHRTYYAMKAQEEFI